MSVIRKAVTDSQKKLLFQGRKRRKEILLFCQAVLTLYLKKKRICHLACSLFVEYFSFVFHKVVTRLKKESDKKAGMEEKYEWL